MSSKNYTQKSTGSPLEIGEGGQKVKSADGTIEHRNAADDDYVIARGADPVGPNDLVTKGSIDAVNADTKEPTGFTEPENVVVTYDATAQTITLTGTVKAYWQGNIVPELISGWTSPSHASTHPTPLQSLFLYYNGSTYQWSTSPWPFSDLQIAFVAFNSNGDYLFTLREPHGMMPWQSHKDFHENVGTWRSAGGDVTGLTPSSTAPDNRRPLVGACTVDDEDIPTTLAAIVTKTNYSRMHLDGAGGVPILTTGEADIAWLNGSSLPQYNEFTGVVWTNTELANNDFMSLWLMVVPAGQDATGSQSQDARFIWWVGQTYSDVLAVERARDPAELNLGEFILAATEFIFIEQVIIKRIGGNWEFVEQRKLTGNKFNLISGGGGGVTDHGALTGLGDDDHTQYLLVNGTRAMTGDLNMGNNAANNVEGIQFQLTPTVVHSEGLAHWSDEDKTLELDTEVTGTAIQVGQEVVIRCTNKTGSLISNGTVVYLSGAQGQRPTITPAIATSEDACKTIGMVTHDIADNNTGYVTVIGLVRDINTAGLTEGEFVFLSETAAGTLRLGQPDAPNKSVRVGIVVYVHATEGKVLVKPFVIPTLSKLSDVNDRGSATDDQVLVWDAGNQRWQPTDHSTLVFDVNTILTDDVTGQVLVDDNTGNVLVDT
jgi:hypothetical protein